MEGGLLDGWQRYTRQEAFVHSVTSWYPEPRQAGADLSSQTVSSSIGPQGQLHMLLFEEGEWASQSGAVLTGSGGGMGSRAVCAGCQGGLL